MSAMREIKDRDIERLLTPDDDPTPPADLKARLIADIPDDLTHTTAGEAAPPEPAAERRRWRRVMPLAAMLVAALGASLIAVRLQQEPPALPSAAEQYDAETAVAERATDAATGAGAVDGTVDRAKADTDGAGSRAEAGEPAGVAGTDETDETDGNTEPVAEDRAAEARRNAIEQRRNELQRTLGGAGPRQPARSDSDRAERARATDDLRVAPPQREAGPPAVAEPPATVSPPATGGRASEAKEGEEGQASHYDFRAASPRLESAKVAPPSAPPARRVPIPDPTPGETRHENRQVEAVNEHIAEMREEAEKLEQELRALGFVDGAATAPDQPAYDAVTFRDYGTNPFVDTEDDPLSTFALDVDTGAYNVMRRYLRDGHLPPPEAVRVEELINRFDYHDPPPRRGEDFALRAEAAPSPYAAGERYYLLRFNLRGRDIAERRRAPADLVFVVDTSGSMAREDRLELVKDALGLLLDALGPEDRIALVTYGTRGRIVLRHTGDRGAIRAALAALTPGGSTNAEEGLVLGYELAEQARRRGAISRVILASDGVANVGRTGPQGILARIAGAAAAGIELTTVGVGMGNYNDVLMEQLADRGNGRYAYVDDLDEAHRIFVEGLTGTLQTIAAEAKVQVAFDPETVARYRLIGYENRDVADADFRNDAVDAGEIGAGHTVTALYEIKLQPAFAGAPPGRRNRVATLTLRYGSVAEGEMVEKTLEVTGKAFAGAWEEASPALKLTAAVAELGEILGASYWARDGDLDAVLAELQRVAPRFAGDRDVAELIGLVARAAELRRARPPG